MRLYHVICASSMLALLAGCARPFPIREGEALTYSRCEVPIPPDGADYKDTLQVRWLGTASHLIQVGDVAVLTDPYFSHYNALRVFFGKIPSDPKSVYDKTHSLPKPNAIVIGHAHFDHLLDLAETRRLCKLQGVPIVGGPTMQHIVAGYRDGTDEDCKLAQTGPDWDELPCGNVAYRAFRAQHAHHVFGVLLFPGALTEPRTTPPTRAENFPVGETYTYLLRLKYGSKDEQRSFTVFFAGAATDADEGIPDDLEQGVDVAILCVPGWMNVSDYPEGVIRRLRPRVIILSHLDNFLQDGWEKRELVATASLRRFLEKARGACDYPEFERIVITDMGSTVRVLPAP